MFVWRLLGVALTVAIGLLPIAPPEHVHEHDSDGHHETVVHRHVQVHHSLPSGDHRHLAWDDDDTPVATLTDEYVAPATVQIGAPPVAAVTVLPVPQPLLLSRAEFVERLIHGPPRSPAALRAPPALLA